MDVKWGRYRSGSRDSDPPFLSVAADVGLSGLYVWTALGSGDRDPPWPETWTC